LSINKIKYDKIVEDQIATQQQALMQIQTAMAKSKEAEQRALTVAKEGEADAAKAKWEQEVIKAKMVTEAEARNAQAKLDEQTATIKKHILILEGEGEGEKKKLAMQANGALEQKLEAWLTAQKYWADAFSNYQGSIVPAYIGGGGNGTGGGTNAFQQFMEMNMFKTAHDLNLEVSPNTKPSKK
jgi:hypothetical protein